MSKQYPFWICGACGMLRGSGHCRVSTWHMPDSANEADRCGWCGTGVHALTEPRDFGYPPAKGGQQ